MEARTRNPLIAGSLDGAASDGDAVILNVNDRDEPRYVVTKLLRTAGYRVLEAASGLEALETARAAGPAVMILDIKLPDIDGLEVCRRLKDDAATAGIMVLHTSASLITLDAKIRGLDVGGAAFLAQPFTAPELIATVRSLVRLKRVEEAQRRRADELAIVDRRKDEFLAMLAHELRNPLAAVVSAQAVIDRRPAHDADEARVRSIERRQVQLLVRLVDDLLDVSRITLNKLVLQKERLDLVALLEHVTASDQLRLLARSQRVELAVPAAPLPIDGDRSRLEQVFTNLLDNASKYSADGSRIAVRVERRDDDDASCAVVTVHDDGVGIAPETLPVLFDLFYQADDRSVRGDGLGVGLSLVRAVTALHGGSVSVRSDGLGTGSTFEVRLPAVRRAELPASATVEGGAPPREGPTASRVANVLIVEDNEDARAALRELCELWGHHVSVAVDGPTGVARALELRPDVAFVDLGLPGLHGYDVARRIRADAAGRDVVLVALSGYGSPEQRTAALAAGFDLHLVKPADVASLKSLLRDPSLARTLGATDLHTVATAPRS